MSNKTTDKSKTETPTRPHEADQAEMQDRSTNYGEAMDAKHAGHASTPESGAVPGDDQLDANRDRAALNLGPEVGPNSISPANTKVPVPTGGAQDGYIGGEKIPGQGNIHQTALPAGHAQAQVEVKMTHLPLTPALSAAMSVAQAGQHKRDALEEIRQKESSNKDSNVRLSGKAGATSRGKGAKGDANYVQGQTTPATEDEGDLYGQGSAARKAKGDKARDPNARPTDEQRKEHAEGTRDAHKKGDLYGQGGKGLADQQGSVLAKGDKGDRASR